MTWLEIGRAEFFLRGWQWDWLDRGSVWTLAVPGLVIRWKRY